MSRWSRAERNSIRTIALRDMRDRVAIAIALIAMPLWILPAAALKGWRAFARPMIIGIPDDLRHIARSGAFNSSSLLALIYPGSVRKRGRAPSSSNVDAVAIYVLPWPESTIERAEIVRNGVAYNASLMSDPLTIICDRPGGTCLAIFVGSNLVGFAFADDPLTGYRAHITLPPEVRARVIYARLNAACQKIAAKADQIAV